MSLPETWLNDPNKESFTTLVLILRAFGYRHSNQGWHVLTLLRHEKEGHAVQKEAVFLTTSFQVWSSNPRSLGSRAVQTATGPLLEVNALLPRSNPAEESSVLLSQSLIRSYLHCLKAVP